MAIQICLNPSICGILPPNGEEETKLSQYADDPTFILSDIHSVNQTWSSMSERQVQKATPLNAKDYGQDHPVTSLNSCYLLSGLMIAFPEPFFGNIDCTRKNIDHRLKSIRSTISAWKHRELNYKGKPLVINGLLTSTLWYTATSISFPTVGHFRDRN